MEDADRLTVLKHDLQILNTANDTYLTQLLNKAKEAISREGITDPAVTGSVEYDFCIIDYAAYLFRVRSTMFALKDVSTVMPRFLRLEINNLKFHQLMNTSTSTSGSTGS